MKYLNLTIVFLLFSLYLHAQTVENIRVEQEGDDKLKITFRIGASTETQVFNVIMSCSMDGGERFEPQAVIGDVGGNIMGGKSYYTIVWDVFKDVDEVVNPEFFVRVELEKDLSPAAAAATRSQTQPGETEEAVQEPAQEPVGEQQFPSAYEQQFETQDEEVEKDPFARNGFFSFSGILFASPRYFGISFGSLDSWGYYVTPIRISVHSYDLQYYDPYYAQYVTDSDVDLHYMMAAGATKHFVTGGVYRLHGYFGGGVHIMGEYLTETLGEPSASAFAMLETGLIHVIGGFECGMGISYSINYPGDGLRFVLGIGIAF
jgi:hypothetical protein